MIVFFFFGKMKPVHVPTSFDGCGRGFCLLHLYLRELIGDGRLVVPDADVGAQSVLVDVDVVVVVVVGQLQRRELGLERRIVAAAAGRRHRRERLPKTNKQTNKKPHPTNKQTKRSKQNVNSGRLAVT